MERAKSVVMFGEWEFPVTCDSPGTFIKEKTEELWESRDEAHKEGYYIGSLSHELTFLIDVRFLTLVMVIIRG